MGSINHLGLTVSDLDRSVEFYRDLTGGVLVGPWDRRGPKVDEVTGYPGVTVRQAFLEVPGADTTIELLQYVGGSDVVIEPDHGHVGAVHVAVEVADLDAALARLAERGVSPLSAPIVASDGPLGGYRCVYVLDPDRIRVELVQAPATTA